MAAGPRNARAGRLTRLGTLRVFLFAGLALAVIGAGFNFLHSRGHPGVGAPNYLAGSTNADTQKMSASLRTQGGRSPSVSARAAPSSVDFDFDFGSILATALDLGPVIFAFQFLVALIPAIIVEVILLPQVQDGLVKLGLKAPEDSRDWVAGSDNSIKVQRAFDFEAWEAQRKNPDRYWSILGNTLGNSTMLARLQAPLFLLNVVAAVTLFYNKSLVAGGFPELALPLLPFSLSSFALGLLVTFRVNTSNVRYVTARNKWGSILNISRDLSQQACLWAQRKEDALDFARWVPAFSLALMCHLRDPRSHDLKTELEAAAGPTESAQGDARGLSASDIQEILDRPEGMNPPHFVLHRLRAKMSGLGVTEEQRLLMEHNITRLVDDLGACENIFATPIPLGFTKHTARFLLVWLALLPLALESQLGFGVVFAQQLLAFGLLGVEDIGIQIEEPFAVLPLKRIATKISLEAQVVRSNADGLNNRSGAWMAPASAGAGAVAETSSVGSPSLVSGSASSTHVEPQHEVPAVAVHAETFVTFEDQFGSETLSLTDFGSWLEEKKLSKYYSTFLEEGYDDLLILSESDPEEIDDLIRACGMQQGHARHFLRGIAELRRQRQSEFQEFQSTVQVPSLVSQ